MLQLSVLLARHKYTEVLINEKKHEKEFEIREFQA